MQVVDVLRYDRNLILLLKLVYKAVSLVGLSLIELVAKHIVEVGNECWVLKPALVRCHLVYGIVLPQSVVATKCLEPRLYGHAGAG